MHKLRINLKVLYYFYLEVSARKCARELNLDYETVAKRYSAFRNAIIKFLEQEFKKLHGRVEADESYFGGKRKGDRGRGAFNKQAVFGILERKGRVYTTTVSNVSAATLLNHIKKNTRKGSVFYTDDFKSYKDLKQYGKHNRIKHSKAFGKGRNHINGIEGFWSYAKERFHKYHGINKKNYFSYVKEMEFRFNHRNKPLYPLLINITRQFAPKMP
ncbi:MAG: IS1595 family transposase [Candidatus Marsarchaeota archaeon]|nr:IS1595 family transposase [Candidatus Marsarchaeota archaeon]